MIDISVYYYYYFFRRKQRIHSIQQLASFQFSIEGMGLRNLIIKTHSIYTFIVLITIQLAQTFASRFNTTH